MDLDDAEFPLKSALWTLGSIVLLLVIIILFVGGCSSADKTGGAQVAVVRNGGPLDNNNIREVIGPSSGLQIPGLFSDWHKYPAGNQARYYTVSSDPTRGDLPGVDFFQVPTQDGVQVRLDATVYFNTAFTSSTGELTNTSHALVSQFDSQYGLRTFPGPSGTGGKAPWDGDAGWADWLNAIFRPVLDNAVRQTISHFDCADLVSSCALVQQSGKKINVSVAQGKQNSKNFAAVQDAINAQLKTNVTSALGGPYLRDLRFKLQDVVLPPDVQNAINQAQSNFAQIAQARASKIQAKFQAQANQQLAHAYKNNPELAYIQAVKELAKSGTNATIVLGNPGAGLTLGGK